MTKHYNGLKTAALIGVLWMMLLAVGALIARGTGSAVWILVFAAIALVQIAVGHWNSDKITLHAMSARPLSPAEVPELHQIVQNLATHAGQPILEFYIAPTKTSNAFTTGHDPEHAAVCVTEGIMDLLELRELRTVFGHELLHVYNRDILTSSVAAGITRAIISIANPFNVKNLFSTYPPMDKRIRRLEKIAGY